MLQNPNELVNVSKCPSLSLSLSLYLSISSFPPLCLASAAFAPARSFSNSVRAHHFDSAIRTEAIFFNCHFTYMWHTATADNIHATIHHFFILLLFLRDAMLSVSVLFERLNFLIYGCHYGGLHCRICKNEDEARYNHLKISNAKSNATSKSACNSIEIERERPKYDTKWMALKYVMSGCQEQAHFKANHYTCSVFVIHTWAWLYISIYLSSVIMLGMLSLRIYSLSLTIWLSLVSLCGHLSLAISVSLSCVFCCCCCYRNGISTLGAKFKSSSADKRR